MMLANICRIGQRRKPSKMYVIMPSSLSSEQVFLGEVEAKVGEAEGLRRV